MKKRKKFKTIAGYLRSMEQDLWHRQAMAERDGKPSISEADGHRRIINNLLPQIGVADSIGQAESPRDGIRRLRATATGDVQIKALDACAKWLDQPGMKLTFLGATSTAVASGMIYRGKDYTQEETEALEKIQREYGVSLDQAIEMTARRP